MTDDGRKGGDVGKNGGGDSGGGDSGGGDGGRNGGERLLEELGRLAREEREEATARLDGRWDALAAGELDDGEAARLRTEAAEAAPAEAEAAWEAFRPFDDEFRQRLLATARGQLAAEGTGEAEEMDKAEDRGGGRVIHGPRRWWLPPAILAAAAALVLLLRPAPAPAPLPGYGLELAGSVRAMRSETPADAPREAPGEAPRHLLAPGNRLRLVLTPEVAVEGPVAARFFLVHDGGTVPLRAPEAAVSEAGAVLLEGVVGGEVPLPEGDSELLVVVGRPGELPDADELRRRLASEADPRSDDWIAWKVPVRLEGGG